MSSAGVARLVTRPRILVAAAALSALATQAGCATSPCKEGTLLLTVNFDSATSPADTVDVTVMAGGAALPSSGYVSHPPGGLTGTIEIDFPHGYPAGMQVDVKLTAVTKSGTTLGTASTSIKTLPAGCATVTVSFGGDGGADG